MQSDKIKYGLNIRLSPEIDLSSINSENDSVQPKIISDGAVVENIADAKKYLESSDEFMALHLASAGVGVLIKVPEGASANVEIESVGKKPSAFESIVVIARENSKLNLTKKITSDTTKYYSDAVTVFAGENSQVNFISIQNLPKDCFYFASKKSTGEKDSSVNWFEANVGSRFTKSKVDSVLAGRGAGTKIYSLHAGDGEQQFDLQANAVHKAESTTSELVSRGVLRGKSKSVYQGNIHIEKGARNSSGHQASKTLLLSAEAEADAVPKLIIDNNDVKCSHESAIGRLDEEKLLYLMSRGIARDEAERLLSGAFFESVLVKLGDEKIRSNVRELVQDE